MENCTPEFFPRVAERGDDKGSGAERAGGLGLEGHEFVTGIVVSDGGKMQMGAGERISPRGHRGTRGKARAAKNGDSAPYPAAWLTNRDGRFHCAPPSSRFPPARPSYKDAIAPSPVLARCWKSGGG